MIQRRSKPAISASPLTQEQKKRMAKRDVDSLSAKWRLKTVDISRPKNYVALWKSINRIHFQLTANEQILAYFILIVKIQYIYSL